MMTASFMRNPTIMKKYGIKPDSMKHSAYLQIWDHVIRSKQMYNIMSSQSLEELQLKMEEVITVGKFLSMQYAIDLNYTELFRFDENEHIVAGPGAERGIQRTFDIQGKPDYVAIIRWVAEQLPNLLTDYGYEFDELPGRMPKLIDIQNCFCETSKYLRGFKPTGEKGDKRIKNFFTPTPSKIEYRFPPKWRINI